MSLKKMSELVRPAHTELRQQLVAEWRNPTDNAEPVIVVDETEQPGTPIRLYVVWSKWEEMNIRERSQVIMAAYQEVEEDGSRLGRVTIAWGMTPAEAKRAGLNV